jgi:hypothetical protein
MKKIKITESDLYNIIKQVLLEQEEENVWYTDADDFKFRLFKAFDGDSEKFAKYHNKFYKKIVVNGVLSLRGTPITSLPDNLHVGGGLDLDETLIESLPDNLHVGGYLDLVGTPITSLPDNLHVGESLDLRETQITSLPDNLSVGGYLDLRETPITSLPDNLVVKGYIYIYGTPLNDNDELVKEYEAKGYKIDIYS